MSAMGAMSFCLLGCQTSWKRVSATLYAHFSTVTFLSTSSPKGPFLIAFWKLTKFCLSLRARYAA